MEIASKLVYKILKAKGVDTIYHANSVITSCQFLRAGALISRGTAGRNGIHQTPQKSDRLDRKLGIWFDVFTDSVDIHARARRANLYGPVLFLLDIALVKRAYTGKVWVTKLNPTKWNGKRHDQRWFTSEDELEESFVKGKFDQMIVFRHSGGELPFKPYLKQILLDDPGIQLTDSNLDLYSVAYGALQAAITEGRLKTKIERRNCPASCDCGRYYHCHPDKAVSMFMPTI